MNPSCPAQLKRTVGYFAGRDAMDIKSFGQKYVDQLVEDGYLTSCADIYTLKEHRKELIEKGIMGREKNTDKILAAIESSKENDAYQLLTGLAIRNVGRTSAKAIMQHYEDIDALAEASVEELCEIPDVGLITAQSIHDYFRDEENRRILKDLGTVVYLKADREVLIGRLERGVEKRPMLSGHDLEKRVDELLAARQDLYVDAADIIIDIGEDDPDTISLRIRKELGL